MATTPMMSTPEEQGLEAGSFSGIKLCFIVNVYCIKIVNVETLLRIFQARVVMTFYCGDTGIPVSSAAELRTGVPI